MTTTQTNDITADTQFQVGAVVKDGVVFPKFRGSWVCGKRPPLLCCEGDYYLLDCGQETETGWLLRRHGQWVTTRETPMPYPEKAEKFDKADTTQT